MLLQCGLPPPHLSQGAPHLKHTSTTVSSRHCHPFPALAVPLAPQLFSLLGVAEFLPSRRATSDLFGQLCSETPALCASIITAIAGFNADNMNMSRLPTMVQYAPSGEAARAVVLSRSARTGWAPARPRRSRPAGDSRLACPLRAWCRCPAGTSVKNLAHWAQAIRKSRERERPLFQRYDYGDVCTLPSGLPKTCNMRRGAAACAAHGACPACAVRLLQARLHRPPVATTAHTPSAAQHKTHSSLPPSPRIAYLLPQGVP